MTIRHPFPIARDVVLTCMVLALATSARAGSDELNVPGLSAPVEILRDRWGIAHIYAQNEHDLFFAQGYNVARDRLFQLELWRRQATGTMAEIQGKIALPRDVGARLLRFRGDMSRELSRYHPRGALIVGAFVEGINAFIAQADREPSRLPIEFKILGIKPGRWTPEVVVSRHNGLFRNVTSEVQTAQLVRTLGSERARRDPQPSPRHPRLEPDAALDLGPIRDAVVGPYQASRANLKFRPEDVAAEYRGKRPMHCRGRGRAGPKGHARATAFRRQQQLGGRGRSHVLSRGRSWPTTRTARSSCPRFATGFTWSRPAGT